MKIWKRILLTGFLPVSFFVAGTGAQVVNSTSSGPESRTLSQSLHPGQAADSPQEMDDYVLGTGDRLTVHVFGAEDFPDRPIEVSADGAINAPMLGPVQASGLALSQLQHELTKRYSTYFKDPQISLYVTDYRSQPVTVVGAVNAPGVVQLRRPTRLMEAISLAGGLRPDAGDKAFITSTVSTGRDGVPTNEPQDNPASFVRHEVDLRKIIDGSDPTMNMFVKANDLISIPKAEMVYVVGDVGRPGGYVLDGHNSSLSVLQAIALAGGINKTAKAKESRILQATSEGGTRRSEEVVDVSKILAAKSPDIALHANDILFIPNSAVKNAALRSIQMAADIGTGLAIWRF